VTEEKQWDRRPCLSTPREGSRHHFISEADRKWIDARRDLVLARTSGWKVSALCQRPKAVILVVARAKTSRIEDGQGRLSHDFRATN
jgi:hypothetical protein